MPAPSAFHSDADIDDLVSQFQARTLPSARWTHEAHLATAVWFLKHYSRDEATCYLRSGIIAYNVAVGGQNTPAGGYHETLTLFWIDVVDRYLEEAGRDRPAVDLLRGLLSAGLADPALPLKYYSRECLFSVQARARWVAPDGKNCR